MNFIIKSGKNSNLFLKIACEQVPPVAPKKILCVKSGFAKIYISFKQILDHLKSVLDLERTCNLVPLG